MGTPQTCDKTCCSVYLNSPILAALCCRESVERSNREICKRLKYKTHLEICKCLQRIKTRNKKILKRLQQNTTFVQDTATDWYRCQLQQLAYASACISDEKRQIINRYNACENKQPQVIDFLPNIQLKACKVCNCRRSLTNRLNAGAEMSKNLSVIKGDSQLYTDLSFPLNVHNQQYLCLKTAKFNKKAEKINIKSNNSECQTVKRLKAGADPYSAQRNSCNLQTKCANFSKGYKRMSPEFANILHSYESQRLKSAPRTIQPRTSDRTDGPSTKLNLQYPAKKKITPAAPCSCSKFKPSSVNLRKTDQRTRRNVKTRTYQYTEEEPPKVSFLQRSKQAIKHFLRRRECASKGECFTIKFVKKKKEQQLMRDQSDRQMFCSCPAPDENNPNSGCQCNTLHADPNAEQEMSTDADQTGKKVSIKENVIEQMYSGPVPQYLEGFTEEDRPCANCPNVKTYTVTIPAGASMLENGTPSRNRKGKKGKRGSKASTVLEYEDQPEIRKFIFPLPAAPPPPPPMCPYPFGTDAGNNAAQGKVVGGCACGKKNEPAEVVEENLACCCDLLSPFAKELKKEEEKRIDEAVERPNEKFECNAGDPHWQPRASAFAHCFNFRRDEKELMKSAEGRLELLQLRKKECEARQKLAREKKKHLDEDCKECEDAQELIVELQIPVPKKIQPSKQSSKQKNKSKAKPKKPEPKPRCQKL